MVAVPPLTRKESPEAPLSAPLPRLTVPPSPVSLTLFVPPEEVTESRLTLTLGVETPVRSNPPPVVLICRVLMASVPTLVPLMAAPLPVLLRLKPERVLPDARVIGLVARVGRVPAARRVVVLTTRA